MSVLLIVAVAAVWFVAIVAVELVPPRSDDTDGDS